MEKKMKQMKPAQSIILMFLLLTTACTHQEHFIKDPLYRQKIETQFKKQEELAKNRKDPLFKILDQGLSLQEKEAMKFLLAHMPLNDLADYDGEFFLEHVRKAFEARETFSWGKDIPDQLFRHFVLPYRVNNENPDNFRSVYFQELKDRVIHLSMKEAVLEVNHWCHEKVAYKPADIRTSSPMSTIKTAFGRCGEESTLTVAALRTIGIPARQCYTPRWAHCDDNHAWVEARVDGKWRYLGACEPEPDLDMAWFTEPARRAVLVHTKVFGQYDGPEEIITKSPQFTEINLTGNYAKTQTLTVKVEDKHGKVVDDADVQFRLYNYAEFYPIARKLTDSKGTCSLNVGLGDLLIWATKGGAFGYKKISAADTDTVVVVLDKDPGAEYTVDYDFFPPIEPKPFPVSKKGKEENDRRLKYEDRLRASYESTFIDKNDAITLASKLGLEPDKVWDYLQKSRGNWQEISNFLTQSAQAPGLFKWALPLLSTVSEKDLRDTPADILSGHLRHSFKYCGNLPKTKRDYFIEYVLNPRIRNEIVVDYKSFFQRQFDADFIKKARQDVSILIRWIRDHIQVHPAANYYNVPITPRGVYRFRVSDSASRDIFFVALCRGFGIPARLEPADKTPQYVSNNRWNDVYFENQPSELVSKGFICLEHVEKGGKLIPGYYIHFTLARYVNGEYHTLDYGENTKLTQFPERLEVQTGHYLLVTGSRLKDGMVLCRLRFFNIKKNQTRRIPLKIRPIEGGDSNKLKIKK
jgi:transglutaminase-like putative cysteine protease